MVPFESVMSVSYLLPIVTKALSLTVFAELSIVTDRRTDRIGIAIVDLMFAVAVYINLLPYLLGFLFALGNESYRSLFANGLRRVGGRTARQLRGE